MKLTMWDAVNIFNNNDYVFDDAQRKIELSVVCALALIFAVCLVSAIILKVKNNKENSEKK